MTSSTDAARACARRAWAWVLSQVRMGADGVWIPVSVSSTDDPSGGPPPDRDCLYDGVAGLAPVLAEIRLSREWTEEEQALAAGIVRRLKGGETRGDPSLYVGLAGCLAGVAILDPAATAGLLSRLADAATPSGWPSPEFDDPPAPINDLVLGDAGIVLVCAWLGEPEGDRLAALGSDALLAAATPTAYGLSWKMYAGDRDRLMPNYSHGTAGVATALAVAGQRLGRGDLIEAAVLGAEHLAQTADLSGDGFRLPIQLPPPEDREPFTYGWCHGPTGTANVFGALRLAGVGSVGGRSCEEWIDRAARSVRDSGLPTRLRPGFWDNDGRCCGTAGVLEATLNWAQDTGDDVHLVFADRLASALVERALVSRDDPTLGYWRYHEHRTAPPELDPGVGWMQGAAGVAAALMHYARVREQGLGAPRVRLPDDWWMGAGPGRAA